MKNLAVAAQNSTSNIPTIFVVLGATGDLIRKKIAAALFHLYKKNELPHSFRVIGVARRPLTDKQFRDFVLQILKSHRHTNIKQCTDFCQLFSYEQGRFENLEDYQKLGQTIQKVEAKWGVCANKLFYIAAPPHLYATILKNLAQSGLTEPCSPEEGWTRILIEKPFGSDISTAQKLESLLEKSFKEIQIYRIDHYLAKEMIQNILTFRFSNNLFERQWSKENLEKIEIKLLEKIGVEKRGSFYDGVGALRDVGQNHLLQMLALVTMEHPLSFEPEAIRTRRAEILQKLSPPSDNEIRQFTFRAQYEGYRKIQGVDPNSKTETYFKIRARLDSPKWREVPIFLESGKRLGEQKKEIIITFKHPTPCLCPPSRREHYTNKIIIRWEPKEEISIHFWSKKPGLKMELEKRTFDFFYRNTANKTQYTEEYEKLLLDAINGDQTLFVSSAEVKAMWRFIDPILNGWQRNLVPLKSYQPDTNEILKEAQLPRKTTSPSTGSIKTGSIKREIGIVGLGKMGSNLSRRLIEKGWQVYGYNRTPEITQKMAQEGLHETYSLKELVQKLSSPRIIWLMIPAGPAVDEVLGELGKILNQGDTIIDGGNSFYRDSIERERRLKKLGIELVDVGVSGGPEGARHGASLMIGGEAKTFKKLEPLFSDLAQEGGYQFFPGAGAGHFVKMIHNGIEYGMMQAIAEGFTILKNSHYQLDLVKVADVYNHGSVIESRLIGWLKDAFEVYGEDLEDVTGVVGHTGEGEWSVKTAKKMKIEVPAIAEALRFRIESEKHPSYTGKILSALRGQFGQHPVLKEKR